MVCPTCGGQMARLPDIIASPDHDPNDDRSRRFIERLLERDPTTEGSVFRVYESRECCGCACRRYIPTPEPESSMADDELSRRRRYDDSVPAIEYIEEKLLRAFEEGLRDTRHALKQDIAALATTVTDNALKATKEHGDVRADLNDLRREVAELKPLQDRVAELQEHDRTDNAVADALERNRKQAEKNRVQVRNWALALMGLIVALAGAVTAVVALFVH